MFIVIPFSPTTARTSPKGPGANLALLVRRTTMALRRHGHKVCVSAVIAADLDPNDPQILQLPQSDDHREIDRIRRQSQAHLFTRGEEEKAADLISFLRQIGADLSAHRFVFLGWNTTERAALIEFLGVMPNHQNVHCVEPSSALQVIPGIFSRLSP